MIKNYIDKNKERFLKELFGLLKIPSISADATYDKDVKNCAEKLKNHLEKIGLEQVAVLETQGQPVVYGEKIIHEKLPTVLVYGHYDVQPADPLELWENPPFEPVIKKTKIHPKGAIFGRGSCDDKGQMFMHIKALEFLILEKKLNCNVKIILEGEEEIGSPNLENFIRKHKNKLKNNCIIISDTSMISNQQPSISTGLRGLSYVEIAVTGPNRDLHSGIYGGAVANPINIVAQIIAKLHDENGQITIPHFYENIAPVSKEERENIAQAPFDLENYKKALHLKALSGEKNYSTLERCTIRPSLDINGIWGGYTGEGAKTVIPAKAYAKISIRTVSGQNHKKVTKDLIQHLENLAPDTVQIKCEIHHGGDAYVMPTNNKEYLAAEKAYQKSFGINPIPQRGGGSIPIVPMFEEVLKSKTLLMGFGLDSDALHSPNEHFGIFNFLKGIETITYFYEYYKKLFFKNENDSRF